MSRKIAIELPDASQLETKMRTGMVRQVREYDVITPLFGGGVEAGKVDELTPVSGKNVRGQLRFWWRALRGGNFNGDLSKMRARENELFGAAATEEDDGTALIQIKRVRCQDGELCQPFKVEMRPDKYRGGMKPVLKPVESVAPHYIAFPLQPEQEVIQRHQKTTPIEAVCSHLRFRLEIEFPEKQRKDAEAALWAWETFGGVGARTRRGFGALCLRKAVEKNARGSSEIAFKRPAANKAAVLQHLSQFISFVEGGHWPQGVPHIGWLRVGNACNNSHEAWTEVIGAYKRFRQHRPPGRSSPGRNDWPEPDVIRNRTGDNSRGHEPRIANREIFPRGAFGLPIIFSFKKSKNPDKKSKKPDRPEPSSTTLQLVGYERLASPLILRPLLCDGNRAVAIATVLEFGGPLPAAYELQGDASGEDVRVQLQPSEANFAPLKTRGATGRTDVIQAFLDFWSP